MLKGRSTLGHTTRVRRSFPGYSCSVSICMVVRIRHAAWGRPIERRHGKNRNLASAFGSLMIPAALMAYVMGFWRLASDMGIAGGFSITGAFSHWQVWMALAVARCI